MSQVKVEVEQHRDKIESKTTPREQMQEMHHTK